MQFFTYLHVGEAFGDELQYLSLPVGKVLDDAGMAGTVISRLFCYVILQLFGICYLGGQELHRL